MDVVIVDSELLRGGRMITSTMEEIVNVNNEYQEIMSRLAQEGFQDLLIRSAVMEKAKDLDEIVKEVSLLTAETMNKVEQFIEKVDEKDKYLY